MFIKHERLTCAHKVNLYTRCKGQKCVLLRVEWIVINLHGTNMTRMRGDAS